MTKAIESIIEGMINNKAIQKDYPQNEVNFQNIGALLKDQRLRAIVKKEVLEQAKDLSFSGVAPIASRGYILSGMLANEEGGSECLIEKVKQQGSPYFLQASSSTEYSKAEHLQVLKDSIEPGKQYLVVDDLIATGGSVETTIELIKASGGLVRDVLVLTELTDFKARERLEKEGINLISLLKFSEQDLTTLLQLQEAYKDNKEVPITFALSHCQKGGVKLVEINHGKATLKAHLASCSRIKETALKAALTSLFSPLEIELTTHQVDSKVNAQPIEEQTKVGANNRLEELVAMGFPDDELLVSIENGLRYDADKKSYFDCVQLTLKHNGVLFEHSEDCCEVPEALIKQMMRDEGGRFQETWGEAVCRLGLATDDKNPHAAKAFGGVSREAHLFQALCKALGRLKKEMLALSDEELSVFEVERWCELKKESHLDDFDEDGIEFEKPEAPIKSRAINLYNQGSPFELWELNDKRSRNSLKVFQTGDPFSVISPEMSLSNKNVNIHCGLEHEQYSETVLLQEALQLCRAAHENGAREIQISLPERCHPVLNPCDFNVLLIDMFKASGANKLYFYDHTFQGKLDEPGLQDKAVLSIDCSMRQKLHEFLTPQRQDKKQNLDHQVLACRRQKRFRTLWEKLTNSSISEFECETSIATKGTYQVPDLKVRPRILLCGAFNQQLANEIAEDLRKKGEIVSVHLIDGRGMNAFIPHGAQICGSRVSIVQSTRPNPYAVSEVENYETNGTTDCFYEALIIAKQAYLRGAISTNLINPYQFGARSDRAEDNPKGKTGSYVQHNGQLLNVAKVSKVITAECHDVHTLSGAYTNESMRGQAVPAMSLIAEQVARAWLASPLCKGAQIRLVTPDAGAAKRTKELTEKLQEILGDKLCKNRILGEKNRSSHEDNSALISALNSGGISINPQDKYLITDDETATGSTLCQAILKLVLDGAKDISVIVVHNNLPLNWLERQLCLARFITLGASDLHFSNTNEMGELATDYETLVSKSMDLYSMSREAVEEKISSWFIENVQRKMNLAHAEFQGFKETFAKLSSTVAVHSLAAEFADRVKTKPYFTSPHAFNFRVEQLCAQIRGAELSVVLAKNDFDLSAYTVAARELNLPLVVQDEKTGDVDEIEQLPDELVNTYLREIERLYGAIKEDEKLNKEPIKLLAVGQEGQRMAGLLCDALYQKGLLVGLALTEEGDDGRLCIDGNNLNVDEVCIPIGAKLTSQCIRDVESLCREAKVRCPYVCNLTEVSGREVQEQNIVAEETQAHFKNSGKILFFNTASKSVTTSKEEQAKQNEAAIEVEQLKYK